jgi:small subunit ribosomal protein S1
MSFEPEQIVQGVSENELEHELEDESWIQLLDEYDYSRPQRGELREGLIMQIEDNGVLVSIGTKREGIIPLQDVRQMGEEFFESLHVGDTIQVYVQDPENRDGDLILSLTMVQVAKDWESAWQLFQEGGIVRCKVIGFNKGGLLVQFNQIRGFVPASQVAQLHGRTAAEERQQALQRMVNQEIPLKVIEVDRDRNRLVFSERSATQEWRKAQKQRLLTELQPGDVLSGRVNQLTNFGAFIDLGGADGLAHISELSWQRVNHPREMLSPGQEVRVMVVEIDRERERIGLSLRKLQENPWETIDQRYTLGQLITGPVTNVTPFGAFVQVEEAVEGLIHASELDVDPQTQPSDVLKSGQDVTAKVISLDRQRQRMGLSLKRVTEDGDSESETEGTDQSEQPESSNASTNGNGDIPPVGEDEADEQSSETASAGMAADGTADTSDDTSTEHKTEADEPQAEASPVDETQAEADTSDEAAKQEAHEIAIGALQTIRTEGTPIPQGGGQPASEPAETEAGEHETDHAGSSSSNIETDHEFQDTTARP